MHPRSILAIARKDALDILLNKTTLSLLLTPIVLALLFLLIANLLGSHTTNALIYDPGRSSVEQVLKSAYADLKITYANSSGDVAAAFGPDGSHKTTSYALGLAIPVGFDASLRSGGHPPLNFFVDCSKGSNHQGQLLLKRLSHFFRNYTT